MCRQFAECYDIWLALDTLGNFLACVPLVIWGAFITEWFRTSRIQATSLSGADSRILHLGLLTRAIACVALPVAVAFLPCFLRKGAASFVCLGVLFSTIPGAIYSRENKWRLFCVAFLFVGLTYLWMLPRGIGLRAPLWWLRGFVGNVQGSEEALGYAWRLSVTYAIALAITKLATATGWLLLRANAVTLERECGDVDSFRRES